MLGLGHHDAWLEMLPWRDKIEGEFRPYCLKLSQAQYTNPVHHQECLRFIANCGKEDLVLNLNEGWAASVKVDGHVDAYQTEKKAVAVTYVTKEGDLFTAFVSTEKPTERGARGVLGAVKNAFSILGWSWEEDAKKKICGITTDGESANTGARGGVWTLLQQECEKNFLCLSQVIIGIQKHKKHNC